MTATPMPSDPTELLCYVRQYVLPKVVVTHDPNGDFQALTKAINDATRGTPLQPELSFTTLAEHLDATLPKNHRFLGFMEMISKLQEDRDEYAIIEIGNPMLKGIIDAFEAVMKAIEPIRPRSRR